MELRPQNKGLFHVNKFKIRFPYSSQYYSVVKVKGGMFTIPTSRLTVRDYMLDELDEEV